MEDKFRVVVISEDNGYILDSKSCKNKAESLKIKEEFLSKIVKGYNVEVIPLR